MRTVCCVLFVILSPTHHALAVVVTHEFAGAVYFSSVAGIKAHDPFVAVLTYDTNQPDLIPADLFQGKYAEFTFSLHAGPISVIQTNPAHYDFGIIDGTSGSSDQLVWFGGIGPGDIGLSAFDRTGTAFDSDALPLQLSISSFDWASIRHFVTGSTRIDGEILSISSWIVPEPSFFAIVALVPPTILAVRARRN